MMTETARRYGGSLYELAKRGWWTRFSHSFAKCWI